MCGIAGYVGKGERDDLTHMIGALRHRGPDDVGVWVEPNIGFAHARLSIIDLSPSGHQPMRSQDGAVTLVFNGEIYNYKELRATLEKSGKSFVGGSDTEVILQLYREEGIVALSKLSGMFAIALHDRNTGRVYLARDRMGEKPLYYSIQNGTLVFASEPKALFFHPAIERTFNTLGIQDYFTYDGVTSPLSMFEDVKKLEPATYLSWKDGTYSIERYWDPPTALFSGSFEEARKEVDQALRKSVESQLLSSDVPVGVFLSGGIDSSLITAYAREVSHTPVKTFSIGFSSASYDESSLARSVAKALGTEHYERILSPEQVRDSLFELIPMLDEPLSDPTILPNYLLAGFARERVTVALGGDGADELFSGYQTFLAERYARLYRSIPKNIRRYVIEPMVRALPVSHGYFSLDFKAKQFIRGFSGPTNRIHQHWIESWNANEIQALILPHVREKMRKDMYAFMDQEIGRLPFQDEHQRVKYRYLRTYLENIILTKVDRSSMMHSLEVRAPFLSTLVVETALRLPESYTISNGEGKRILRTLMNEKLPPEILKRKKHGFALPVGEWLRGPWKELLMDTLSPHRVASVGICDPQYIRRLLDEHITGKVNHRKKLWSLLMFHLWYDAQIRKNI